MKFLQPFLLGNLFRNICRTEWTQRLNSSSSNSNNCVPDPCKDLRDVKMDIFCKVAIVTGGGSGIGYASAYELLNNGAKDFKNKEQSLDHTDCPALNGPNVYVCRNPEPDIFYYVHIGELVVIAHQNETKGTEAAKCLCNQFGMNKAIYLPCDIRCPKQFEDVFLNTINCSRKVDILLNNAGVIDDKNWESSVAINVIGTLRGNLLALKYMEGSDSAVINTCALAGLSPWPNCPIFAASKHAIVTATRCFGDPYHFKKTKIRFMGLCPGYTNTHIWDKGIARHLDVEWGKDTMNCLQRIRMQPPSLVGKAMIHLIKYGKSGKIYVCEHGELHKVAFPRAEDVMCAEPLT